MAPSQPPADRRSFRVAIICALPREADAVTLLFDQFWDEVRDPYGRADGDTNTYITGRIGDHSIVLANTVEDSLTRANRDIRGLLAVFETELMRERLQAEASGHLKHLQKVARDKRRRANYRYPGTTEDRLYSRNHIHKHWDSCDLCADGSGAFCEAASKASCADTKCGSADLVVREHHARDDDFRPEIYMGRIGSGNTVIKSGEDRDRIAAQHNLIAFEMEGAGAWDEVPCIVVKGLCDYADSHKNKAWQDFAAATAASVAKAILGRYAAHDGTDGDVGGNLTY
ncbi:uncharacterized protein J7T54_004899 [Emericellopsis cladophorae]|uniref:Nucleoside phosphorylase domain-containing protein n=1 Tax=Emericellopsis cladophorae TaxID=2686198 RepID=A0A9P9XTK8_9HYPO|nr:uncharacterized protein J7T54_004899 [Emericellopsis cladophorae]KAI6777616.1 hypothetical protein J7T54_004899 [Emericellopsis cladophorae]